MKVGDLVKISSETLKTLSMFDIRIDDFKYIEMFADYEKLARDGNKTTYIASFLSSKYNISEATVYRVLRRFRVTV